MIIAMQKTAPLWLEDQIKSGRILGQIVAPSPSSGGGGASLQS